MEPLLEEFKQLSLTKKKPTGLIYHPDTLLHTYDPEEKKAKLHCENPYRVKSILDRIKSKNLHEKCDFVQDFEEIDEQIVRSIHSDNYIEYFTTLWPEDSKRTKMVYLDTYYNQHTKRAAFLAAEGTRIAVHNVFEGKWENSFALVRPPGHHAAAKNNRIQGFCMLNNVIVAIKSLIAKKGKIKFAILDWDVHHGDSSQKMAYDDPDILYISIHKFMDGVFYPGESGAVDNLGSGKGEGYNLNFPLNPIKNQFIGDSEYIYIFERAILPVLKEFKPEMVVISCGFDCLINDPIGGLYVTENALSYMTLQIQQQVSKKISIVLEGGYNLDEIAVAGECLLRVLIGEFYPNEACRAKLSPKQFIKYLMISPIFMEQCQKNIDVWSKYWKCLDDKSFQQKAEKTMSNPFFINNKHKYGNINGALKRYKCKLNCLDAYDYIFNKFGKVIYDFVPKLIEKEVHGNNVDMIFENMNFDGKMNAINIAICDSSTLGFADCEIFEKYRFYVQSYCIMNKDVQILEARKGPFLSLDEKETFDYFLRILRVKKDKNVALQAIDKIIEFIDKSVLFMKENHLTLINSKLLIFFNPPKGEIICRFANFEDYEEFFSSNFEICLNGIKQFFIDFKKIAQNK